MKENEFHSKNIYFKLTQRMVKDEFNKYGDSLAHLKFLLAGITVKFL